jgi:hypothetical protein
MAKKMNKIQKVKYFEDRVKFWFKYFGMVDYEVSVNKKVNDNAIATCYWHNLQDKPFEDGRIFNIVYSNEWILSDIGKDEIDMVAFHETLEAMLYRLRDFAFNQEYVVSAREIDSEIHKIIRTFENTVFEHLPKR